ncbi:MAG: hypothetical protein GQ532_03435 [Methylomarinum sp.]|nr:hypothetical protein [Methylomarinum sp.]
MFKMLSNYFHYLLQILFFKKNSILTIIFITASTLAFATPKMTGFKPDLHGYRFVNSFRNDFIKEFDVTTGGLCGGMVYSALDYYFKHKAISQQNYRPAVQTPLHDYIYDRQVHSLADNLDKWAETGFNPFGWRNSEFFNWGLQGFNGGRIQELREAIDRGRPIPLGLQSYGGKENNMDRTGNHQVLAIGYDMGRYKGDLKTNKEDLKIFIYDPNHPNIIRTLVPDIKTASYYYRDNYTGTDTKFNRWRTYFVDKKYSVHTPPKTASTIRNTNSKLVRELIFEITTGNDDLRGGNDNLNIIIYTKENLPQTFKNINRSKHWIGNYTQTVKVTLKKPIPVTDILRVTLTTTFSGGMFGDNWNMNGLKISALGDQLYDEHENPLFRFTGERKAFTAHIVKPSTTVVTAHPPLGKCIAQVENKISWDYKGNKRWGAKNLSRLCRGEEGSIEPASCFDKVMHGGINWGGGTQWKWQNAINLCEGVTNANATIRCFQGEIKRGKIWQNAITTCEK